MDQSGSPTPDEKQREAVNCGVNAVVSAGAGSGKTFVLTERFYRLVADGKAGADQILTLTFTRKAAAEMFERIYRRLLRDKNSSPRIAEQILKFDEAQISTLDSFCSQIARSGAGLFGISPDFRIDNGGARRLVENRAFDFILRRRNDEVLQRFIVKFGFRRVWDSLFTSYGFEYVNCAVPMDFTAMERDQRGLLLQRLQFHWERFFTAARHIMDLDPEEGKAIQNNQTALGRLSDLEAAVSSADFPALGDLLREIELSKRGTGKSGKESLSSLAVNVDECKTHQGGLLIIAETLANWGDSGRMFSLLREFQQEVMEEKRRSGTLTYHDVQQLALEVLKTEEGIRKYYKSMFRYIMIDEFQDNNGDQKRLLYFLAEKEGLFKEAPRAEDLEPGKLFFVGDDKQSIYRFRGADVSVFKNLCGELTGEEGIHIEMDRNYRSNSGLIAFFNTMFQTVLAGSGIPPDEQLPFEADFSSLRTGSPGQEMKGEVHLMFKPYDKDEDKALFAGSDEAEAHMTADFIRERVEGKSLLIRAGEGKRAAEYGDFALLMRSTGNQAVFEKVFREKGIPYSTDNVRTLFLEAPFNDIYNLLQLAMFPSDRAAYAGFLRSPLVNCSDETVFRLLTLDASPFPDFNPAAPDRGGYEKGRELYHFLQRRINAWSVSRLVDYIWYEAGYRYLLLADAAHHPYLEYYDYLYYLAMDADREGISLSEFLDFMRDNLGKFERIDEIDMINDAGGGVQILTIHKSKGLEFPVILLANTGNVGSQGGSDSLYYYSPGYGITFTGGAGSGKGGNYFYSLLLEEERLKEIAEIKRLLYVACTRAADHLVISGCHHRNNRGREDAMLNMVLQALGIDEDTPAGEIPLPGNGGPGSGYLKFIKIAPLLKTLVPQKRGAADLPVLARKIDTFTSLPVRRYSLMKHEFRVTELSSHVETAGVPENIRSQDLLPPLASDKYLGNEKNAADFGTLFHYVIEHAIKGDFTWDSIPDFLLRDLPAAGLDVMKTDIDALAARFFSGDFWSSLDPGGERETEKDFLSRYETPRGEFFLRGRIDLIVLMQTETLVIDFKTDRFKLPRVHAEQLHMYARAAREIYGKPVRCFLVYLRSGEAVEIKADYTYVPEIPPAEVFPCDGS